MCRPPGFGLAGAINRWLMPPAVRVSPSGLCCKKPGSPNAIQASGRHIPAGGVSHRKGNSKTKSPEGDTSPHSRSMCRPPGFGHVADSIWWLTPPEWRSGILGVSIRPVPFWAKRNDMFLRSQLRQNSMAFPWKPSEFSRNRLLSAQTTRRIVVDIETGGR